MTVNAAISAAAANALLYAWFATVLVSALYVAFDAFTNNPELRHERMLSRLRVRTSVE